MFPPEGTDPRRSFITAVTVNPPDGTVYVGLLATRRSARYSTIIVEVATIVDENFETARLSGRCP